MSRLAPKNLDQWSSKLGFILATTGAAVGLGNIWKFPYMAGSNGGSGFVLIYLICVIIIGVPLMLAEMLIGRLGQHNPINSLANLATTANHSKHWSMLGWWGAATLFFVLSFYSVVAGWSIFYLFEAITGKLNNLSPTEINSLWHHFIGSASQLTICHSIFMLLTIWVVSRGVQAGLEKASKYMMPCLFAILIILVGYSASLPGFEHAWHFLFDFKQSHITGAVIISAMGHAFFTLAVGAGCMLVYGAYLPNHQPLGQSIIWIVALDLLVAILAGMAIFPLVFTYHIPPQGGPGLMFEALPIAFSKMGGGAFFGALFFILLIFAAWTSSISLAEPLVMIIKERTHLSRRQGSWVVGIAAWIVGVICLLSFNHLKFVVLFHHWDLFNALADLTTNIMLPLGGLGFAWFAGRCIKKHISQQTLNLKYSSNFEIWYLLIRWITPIAVIIILIDALLN